MNIKILFVFVVYIKKIIYFCKIKEKEHFLLIYYKILAKS